MIHKNMHKNEIVEILEGKGDFVKIDYLNRYLKIMPPIEMRKFAYIQLAEIYLLKEMFADAANMYKNVAINSITFSEKQKNYIKESKAWILAGKFDESDRALKRAFSEANSKERESISKEIIEFYKKEAENLEKGIKHSQTIKIYEKMLKIRLSDQEKEEIKRKLLKLYEKMGRMQDYNFLKSLTNF